MKLTPGKLIAVALLVLASLIADLESATPLEQGEAAFKLGKIRSVEALTKRLDHPSVSARLMVTDALGKIKANPDRVVPALVARLQDDYSSIRSVAARTLGEFGSEAKGAIPALNELLAEDQPSDVRRTATEAIEKIEAHE